MPTQPTTKSFDGPGGRRVEIRETDDRDKPFPLAASGLLNVLGFQDFQIIYQETMERARRGHVLIALTLATDAAFTGQYVAAEFNVLGFTYAGAQVIYRGALDGFLPMQSVTWEEPETYHSIGIEAREIVDGRPSSSATGITALKLAVSGHYWR